MVPSPYAEYWRHPRMDDMLLWSVDHRYGLSLSASLLQRGLEECANSCDRETGGILAGYYTPAHDCAVITALCGPPGDSTRERSRFVRGISGVQDWILELWRGTRHYYLGEWHFHPNGAPEPSVVDVEQMRRLSMDKKLRCPEPILLTIGSAPGGTWGLGAFVFPVGQECVPLRPPDGCASRLPKGAAGRPC